MRVKPFIAGLTMKRTTDQTIQEASTGEEKPSVGNQQETRDIVLPQKEIK